MPAVGVSAHDEACSFTDGLQDFVRHERGRNGCIPGAEAFPDCNDIGGGVPMLQSKPFARSPKPGHHLIGHKQDFILFTDRLHLAVILWLGGECRSRRADHGFRNEGRNVPGPDSADHLLELPNLFLDTVILKVGGQAGIFFQRVLKPLAPERKAQRASYDLRGDPITYSLE